HVPNFVTKREKEASEGRESEKRNPQSKRKIKSCFNRFRKSLIVGIRSTTRATKE
ncbi:hypothetical protein HMPREF0083_00479, partial [Aneurinibacillus aneurinilyticus ATCC 12856]